jgi:exopolysaccharide biosynthesis polyprenyl glycosylphosphotransferase
MKKKQQLAKYIFSDLLLSIVVWTLFYFFRLIKINLILPEDVLIYVPVYNFLMLLWIIPFFWAFIYYISGYYNQPLRKSRLSELLTTFISTFIGCLILFFLLLIDDPVVSYTFYYVSFSVLFLLQFLFTYIGRVIITQAATEKIHNRIWGINTLIIGTGENALKISTELNGMKQSLGNKIIGFISIEHENCKVEKKTIVGTLSKIDKIIEEQKIEEVIIAIDNNDNNFIFNILGRLYKHKIEIKTFPNLYEILSGGIKMSSIYGTPLINLSSNDMPFWQQNIKRMLDIFLSIFVLTFLSPLFLYLAIRVKMSSPGPIFYTQERIGKHGKPFQMIKFRTMRVNSEANSPMLTAENDERITSFGKKIRKYRFDELPQFLNVLKGNMSIVGYRPERRYFIEKIAEKAPHYYLLQKIRPGITSWGMVKYGYADSVDKMIERLSYDIIYIENMSLIIDIKILIYTFKIIFNGRGV